ncbi:hypothetical protein V6N12_018881 [Hibiscus sabdariffa]|uniref:Uncharacterized protein n=1 Tax=Hibiscus sabdariffa TaxID=183260 RepID=A0ABR2ATF7_9ROSI
MGGKWKLPRASFLAAGNLNWPLKNIKNMSYTWHSCRGDQPALKRYSEMNLAGSESTFYFSFLICTIISSCGLFCIVKCAIRGSISPSPKLANVGVEQKAVYAFPVVKYANCQTGRDFAGAGNHEHRRELEAVHNYRDN